MATRLMTDSHRSSTGGTLAWRRLIAVVSPALIVVAGVRGDWTNLGGNAARNGQSAAVGPTAADLRWSNADDFSIISWHPLVMGARAFAIRESGFPSASGPGDALFAYDLASGDVAWSIEVPYGGDPAEEWIAYAAGARDGRVYCARGGSGRTTPVYAIEAADGDVVWTSVYETGAGPQDAIVFAPNGDLIVGDFDDVARIDAADGSTVWMTPRSCSVSGSCGAAATAAAVFIVEAAPGGQVITKIDIGTGAVIASTPVMAGFTAQNAPFLSADGQTVFFARSQNNAAVDRLYAFRDLGTSFTERWSRPIRWTTVHEHGIAPDGSIYTFLPGNEFVRLAPADGSVIDSAGVLGPIGTNLSPRTAVDANGTVYVSNGWANDPATDGRIWAFNADLSESLFTLTLDRPNSGGPSLGADGTLVVADRQGVRAYRTPAAACPADVDGDGVVGFSDLVAVLSRWGACPECPEDVDGDGDVGFRDLLAVLSAWGPCT